MKQVCLLCFVVSLAAAASAQLALMPVHDAPKWQVLSGLPEAPGAAVAVSSLSTNQVIGQLKPDEKFLAFGTDGKVVTFGFNGTIGYIPATAVRDLYPLEQRSTEWKAYGKTIEETAAEEKAKENDIKGRSLAPLPKTPKASGAASGAGGAPGAAMDSGGGRRGGGGGGKSGGI
ncbi:MAG: hypothetical protein ACR2IE_10375 [Candidatus Sumerlaeaceae bacterium]